MYVMAPTMPVGAVPEGNELLLPVNHCDRIGVSQMDQHLDPEKYGEKNNTSTKSGSPNSYAVSCEFRASLLNTQLNMSILQQS